MLELKESDTVVVSRQALSLHVCFYKGLPHSSAACMAAAILAPLGPAAAAQAVSDAAGAADAVSQISCVAAVLGNLLEAAPLILQVCIPIGTHFLSLAGRSRKPQSAIRAARPTPMLLIKIRCCPSRKVYRVMLANFEAPLPKLQETMTTIKCDS